MYFFFTKVPFDAKINSFSYSSVPFQIFSFATLAQIDVLYGFVCLCLSLPLSLFSIKQWCFFFLFLKSKLVPNEKTKKLGLVFKPTNHLFYFLFFAISYCCCYCCCSSQNSQHFGQEFILNTKSLTEMRVRLRV